MYSAWVIYFEPENFIQPLINCISKFIFVLLKYQPLLAMHVVTHLANFNEFIFVEVMFFKISENKQMKPYYSCKVVITV